MRTNRVIRSVITHARAHYATHEAYVCIALHAILDFAVEITQHAFHQMKIFGFSDGGADYS